MALFMAWVELDTIRLVGRCRSDTMIRYLHTTEKSFTEGLSENMFKHGVYALIPPAHAGNKCRMALKGPQGPFYKGFLEAGDRISVVSAT